MSALIEKWPLGINDDMDENATWNNLQHWSCCDPAGNWNWVRRDGLTANLVEGNLWLQLAKVDNEQPIGKTDGKS